MFECGKNVRQEPHSILLGGTESLVEELLGLEHLNVLTVTLRSFHALQRLLSSPRIKSTTIPSLCLRDYLHSKKLSLFPLTSCRHLQTLHLGYNDLEEVEIDYAAGELKKIREIRGFHSLQNIYISDCKLKHLTWLVLAPNLKRLKISSCCNLKEIISAERLAEANENLIPFGRLEYLILEGLNHLKSIHSTALPFPHLKEISVRGCAEFKRLPLDCNSGLERKIVIKVPRFWWHQLQWDDRATEYAFLPCFQTNF